MPRPKKKGPNDCLLELRQKVETFTQIVDSISEIGALVRMILSVMKGELKDLEKRVCPECGLIHSPYGTKRH